MEDGFVIYLWEIFGTIMQTRGKVDLINDMRKIMNFVMSTELQKAEYSSRRWTRLRTK
jgi:hypothetical protein